MTRRYPLTPTGRASEVVQTGPDRCPAGHPLRPPNVRVSSLPCSCALPATVHLCWTCAQCGAAIFDPPHDPVMVIEQGRH